MQICRIEKRARSWKSLQHLHGAGVCKERCRLVHNNSDKTSSKNILDDKESR
ncbi:hypothetical protein ACS0TY_015047 [Phlomoides rotata]